MKALAFTRFGRAEEVVALLDVADPPRPGPGEVEVAMAAAPINPADLLKAEGRYGSHPAALPALCGSEGLGEVVRCGPAVGHLKEGDRVLLRLAGVPTWQERVTVPAGRLFPLPAGDPLQLAMLAANPATAHLLLTRFVPLSAGDWIAQNAANSAVGHMVVQLAKARGVRTVNLVRRPGAIPALEALGADVVVEDGPDLAARLLDRTGGERPRLGLDAVGGSATRRLGNALVAGGVLVAYGLLSGEPCAIDAADLVFRDLTAKGFWLAPWLEGADVASLSSMYGELAGLVGANRLGVPVEATYRLDQHAEALAHAGRAHRQGKILFLGSHRQKGGVRS